MKEDASIDENCREFTRVLISIQLAINAFDSTTICGRIHDLSLNGVSARCSGRLPVQSPCTIKIYLDGPDNEDIHLQLNGKVMRHMQDGMGIQFTGVPLDDLEHLRNLIRYNAQEPDLIEQEFSAHLGLNKQQIT